MTDKNKTNRKLNILEFLGILMIVIGLGIVVYDFATEYFERKSIADEMQAFLDATSITAPVDENLSEEANNADIWGTIEIEKLNVYHPVIQSSDWGYLSRYVVAWENAPVPPNQGNFSIAGHNGRCASCVFRNLDTLETNDIIKLKDRENTYVYSVYSLSKVHYTDTSVLNDVPDRTILTLITCSEPNTYDEWRVIVKAELVETIPNS